MITEIKEEKERVILVAVCSQNQSEEVVHKSLEELEDLCKTAGAEVICYMIQNRERVHNALYLGTGKVQEVKEEIERTGATGIVADDELSPSQMKNLEQELGVKIMDRTMVILDIFAKHAKSREGQIQVELAQLKYSSGRLTGKGIAMSRLGGGIGTRGPGESKLETDRRLIRDRIGQLGAELKDIEKHRELTRARRKKESKKVAAIVGYTNAGKSTLLNSLTDAGILAEDMLFATLDTTTRVLELERGQEILLTDTVGFISKLPHHLVDAFKSTLEEAKYADYIIHVVDASNPEAAMQMRTVYETLDSLGATGKPVLTLYNKIDRIEEPSDADLGPFFDDRADKMLRISAKQQIGFEDIKLALADFMRDGKRYVDTVLDFSQGGILAEIRKRGELLEEEYTNDGIHIRAYIPSDIVLPQVN